MNVFLAHIDFMPIIYGLVMFLGISVLFQKLLSGKWLSLAIDIAVFFFVFGLHGESMTGGFSAMIAALLAGVTFPYMLRRTFSKQSA
jgi:hypothetical protein